MRAAQSLYHASNGDYMEFLDPRNFNKDSDQNVSYFAAEYQSHSPDRAARLQAGTHAREPM
jgi:hypothetical protein